MTFEKAVIALARRESGKKIPRSAVVETDMTVEGCETCGQWPSITVFVTWTEKSKRNVLWKKEYTNVPSLWKDLMPE